MKFETAPAFRNTGSYYETRIAQNVSFNDANITNVGDIAVDSISADGTDINVAIDDNSATAFTIKQGSDAYLIVDTADSSESVSIGTGISGTVITIGHGTSETTVADNLNVTGNTDVTGTLHADGAISGDSTLQIDGIAGLGGATSATKQVAITSALETHDSNILYASRSYTDATDNSIQGINVAQQRGRITATFAGSSKGMYVVSQVADGNRQAWSRTNGALVGVDVLLGSGGANATGAIASAVGFNSYITMGGYGANATVTNYYGFRETGLGNGTSTTRYAFYAADTGGIVDTQYGVWIDDMDGAATNNYGIYVKNADTLSLWIDAGVSRFDGAISLGTDMGDDGQQLTSGGDDAACDWTAASSLREHKHIGKEADRNEALQTMLGSKAYHFQYRQKMGTGDSATEYVGLMADDAPWAMHYKGKIVNPVNTLGYTVLSIQALNDKIEKLEQELSEVRNVN